MKIKNKNQTKRFNQYELFKLNGPFTSPTNLVLNKQHL